MQSLFGAETSINSVAFSAIGAVVVLLLQLVNILLLLLIKFICFEEIAIKLVFTQPTNRFTINIFRLFQGGFHASDIFFVLVGVSLTHTYCNYVDNVIHI